MEALDPVLVWLKGLGALLGAEPALIPSAICTAIACRFVRASVEKVASGWMYLGVIAVGVAAGCTPWFGGSGVNPGAASLSFIALTLLLQRGLQGLAEWEKLPEWARFVLPPDNHYVKPKDPPVEPDA